MWLREIKEEMYRGVVVCTHTKLNLPGDARGVCRRQIENAKMGLRRRIYQQQMKQRFGDAGGASEEGCLRGEEVQ